VQSSERGQERRSTSPCAAIAKYVCAAHDGERWWTWWSSSEPSEPITEVDATSDRILATLGFAQ
jgi:hypothetical protein